MRLGVDDRAPAAVERRADRVGARRQLGAGGADADPDLAARVVQAVLRRSRRRAARVPRRRAVSARVGSRRGWLPPSALREHGIRIGALEPGAERTRSRTSAGVRRGPRHGLPRRAEPPAGRGVARTGVTAIVPGAPETLWASRCRPGVAVLNGAGEMTGALQVAEWGLIETPIYLTSTMAVGRVYDGAVAAAVAAEPAVGIEDVVIPVVAECDDSWLNDAAHRPGRGRGRRARAGAAATRRRDRRGRRRRRRRAWSASAARAASGRRAGSTEGGAVVGVLLLANFGSARSCASTACRSGGCSRAEPTGPRAPAGSCIVDRGDRRPAGAARTSRGWRAAPASGLARTRLGRPPRQR